VKNLVGTFYELSLVPVDPLVLRTLPEELSPGMAEAMKRGAIGDSGCSRSSEGGGPGWEVVAADPREEGQRTILNLGHAAGTPWRPSTG